MNETTDDLKESLKEIAIVHIAERAYYRAYPRKNNSEHKKRVINKLIAFIKEDSDMPTMRLLVSYAKDCY